MEKYAVPVAPIGENPRPIARSHWKRSLIQLTGKSDRHYLHDVAPRLMQSYSEVACTSLRNNEVLIFDIGYASSEPTEVLRKRSAVSVHGSSVRLGLSDIALSNDDARSCVIGASKSGFIYIWDLRGGRSSAAFQSHKEAQSSILPKEIQSININPSCPYQLGFHLDDGWSGVLDLHNFQVSHIHCPPPTWLDQLNAALFISLSRKPSWLPKHSIYAVGSTSSNGLHLLDFYPHTSSPCHVDYDDSKNPSETFECKQNVFVPLSGHVTACAAHPLNGTIVAGTAEASLLMISQKHLCKKGDGNDDEHS
ncbi:putative WD40/YVTN repeat-like-containing domain superfamily [Helianthus annuus]|uniref:WD40/YVTN repeat-like-containing domain superfamily n=1 Tax=Helianthus annuus TaxID=4232 RepID=A0A9K3EB58_HELAN|nr:putative WD40/YVTN repeat-like-containing domain superfamily [Helianthus annuus]KAJ0465181.1 putative transcription factor WD40-like family [Helianthus annuus]KAJ0486774.1 putative transcription factor WD40-like family [Helianthus annuus]KAJ0660907.1 putative transcription factor WD40-like family [Helianthus annuus]